MRNLKRFLAMAITMLMIVSCFSMLGSASAFDDVTDYSEEIDLLSTLEIIKGFSDTEFRPNDDVTRWQMALLLAKELTGKTGTDYWYQTSNYTNFADLKVDNYYGSVAYAANNGIIVGTSKTTFDPEANIMYQDALTMAVRACGYTITAAEYPFKAIDIAMKLGLDDGIEITDYEKTLTRGQTAKLLYNLLLAEVDGKTFAETSFNLTQKNVVIIASDNNGGHDVTLEAGIAINRTGYVAFSELQTTGLHNIVANTAAGNRGTVANVYYLPKAAFGITDDADNYVGASYKVLTDDEFVTLIKAIPNTSKKVDQETLKGTLGSTYSPIITIEGTSYRVMPVETGYTRLKNGQGSQLGSQHEILVYNRSAAGVTAGASMVTDIYGNCYDANGNIVIYYVPGSIATYGTNYLVKIDANVYRAAGADDWNNVALLGAGAVTYSGIGLAAEQRQILANNNAYSDATLYDDDNDGLWDRAFYTYFSFGKYTVNSSGYACINGTSTGSKPAAIKYIDGEGKSISAPTSGKYMLYAYNAAAKIFTVKEVFTPETGLLSAYNQAAKTVTIGGVEYTLGIAYLPGGNFITDKEDYYYISSAPKAYVPSQRNVNINDPASMIGQNVYFVLKDGKIVALYNTTSAAIDVVFDTLTGITTAGYLTAKVYTPTGAGIITVATIDGYSYYQYYYPTLTNINTLLKRGQLYSATIDASGNYHLVTVNPATSTTYYTKATQYTLSFTNGISNAALAGQKVYSANGNEVTMTRFMAATTTVYIWYDAAVDQFFVQTGLPMDNSGFVMDTDSYMLLKQTSASVPPTFIYFSSATMIPGSRFSNTDWRITSYNYTGSTVIYYDKDSTIAITDQISTGGVMLGNVYTVSNVIDVLNGGLITVYSTAYNAQLEKGCFYEVQNGYIYKKVDLAAADSVIKVGVLKAINRYTSTLVDEHNNPVAVPTSAKTIYYYLDLATSDIFSTYDAYAKGLPFDFQTSVTDTKALGMLATYSTTGAFVSRQYVADRIKTVYKLAHGTTTNDVNVKTPYDYTSIQYGSSPTKIEVAPVLADSIVYYYAGQYTTSAYQVYIGFENWNNYKNANTTSMGAVAGVYDIDAAGVATVNAAPAATNYVKVSTAVYNVMAQRITAGDKFYLVDAAGNMVAALKNPRFIINLEAGAPVYYMPITAADLGLTAGQTYAGVCAIAYNPSNMSVATTENPYRQVTNVSLNLVG